MTKNGKGEIEITIGKKGNCTYEVIDVKGKSCVSITEAFEQATGKQKGERKLKSSFHQKEVEFVKSKH